MTHLTAGDRVRVKADGRIMWVQKSQDVAGTEVYLLNEHNRKDEPLVPFRREEIVVGHYGGKWQDDE